MSKYSSLMAILITAMFLTVLLPLSFDGAGANYGKNVNAKDTNASFISKLANANLGDSEYTTSHGDVNGDGIDDLLMAAPFAPNGSMLNAGMVFLFFGKTSGWAKGVNTASADVTFVGEMADDNLGTAIAIVGDVNGDGYADILMGTYGANGKVGRTYLVLGKHSGWTSTFYMSNAAASFDGQTGGDLAGRVCGGVGDINGDGFDDFYIGAPQRDQPYLDNGRVYVFLGKATGWAKHTNVSASDASFNAENDAFLGGNLNGAGDINGDAYDDLVMGASSADSGKGAVFIMFGKKAGWANNVNLSTSADASILGEAVSADFGDHISVGGDVNGDGINDIVIGAYNDDSVATHAGKMYIFFGRTTGWTKNMLASNADATFLGEAAQDHAGAYFGSNGDVNGDGIADIFLGAPDSTSGFVEAGNSYVILGKKAGWAKGVSLSNADASFHGEAANDYLGLSVASTGDINGDGFDDLSIGAPGNDEGANNGGKNYLIFFDTNKPPTAITSVKAFASPDYTNETAFAMPGDTIYLELRGTDGNASRKDVAVVKLMTDSAPVGYDLRLYETGINTGIYRGSFKLASRTWEEHHWIKGTVGDMVMATAFTDLTKSAMLTVGSVEIMPKADKTTALEDHLYNAHYYVVNVSTPSGVFETNATWLGMNGSTGNVSGTPDNSNVGSFWVRLNVTDAFGRSDEHNFTVVVANTPPVITTTDVTTVDEDEYYAVDYNSSDDGQGVITWHLATDANWLKINKTTGLLNGTPVNQNVGLWYVNVSVDDGHGGKAFHNFTLTVVNFNDKPSINTTDVTTATETVLYQVDYKVVDVDVGDTFTWSLKTNAKFLKINATTGRLNGTPTYDDAGSYWVNVTVTDQGGLFDYSNFTLVVLNTDRPPVWKDVPPLADTINSLQNYTFDVNATDPDNGDKLTYGAIVTPSVSSVSINMTTGMFSFGPVNAGVYNVNLTVTDSKFTIHYLFKLTVVHKNSPPTVVLTAPATGSTVASAKPVLTWTTGDKDGDVVTVDVYFSDVAANVNTKVASALVLSASKAKSYAVPSYLVPGKTYYWTAIPYDGNDTGSCLNGTVIFIVSATAHVNHAPTITAPTKVPDATTGKDYKLTVKGSDQDAGTVLTYSLTGAPAGMSISSSGQITWTPTKDQTGNFPFHVVVSDGEFSASTPVTLYVNKASELNYASMMIPIALILILAILAIVLLAMGMSKKPSGKEDEEEGAAGKEEEEEEEAGEEEEEGGEEEEKVGDEEEEKADEKEATDEKAGGEEE